MRRSSIAILLLGVIAAGCGGEASSREPVVTVEAPRLDGRRAAPAHTLEPLPTPAPTPTPSPSPTPSPTPEPLARPRGARVTAASGSQAGATQSFCWTGGAGGECYPAEPAPAAPLDVRKGEVVLLRIDADRTPDEVKIQPFQGSRENFPATQVDPALETELTVDLAPGDWTMDLCATWRRHGQPVCWIFSMRVI